MGASAKILTSIPATRESFMAAVSLHPNKRAYFSLVPGGVSLPFHVCYGVAGLRKPCPAELLGRGGEVMGVTWLGGPGPQ